MIIKYGEYCRHCGKLPHEVNLYLNKRDRNDEKNTVDNYQFLCKSCIAFRKKIESRNDLCVNNSEETAIKINRKKEPIFRNAIYMLIDGDEVDYHDIINSAAEILHLSPVTTKRYLNTMTSNWGRLKKGWEWGELIVKFKSETDKKIICRKKGINYEDL